MEIFLRLDVWDGVGMVWGWCGDGVGMVWEGIEEAEEAGGGEWGRGRRRWSRG